MWLAMPHIPENESRLLSLMDPETNPLRSFPLEEMSSTEAAIFRQAIEAAHEDAKEAGPESFDEPEFYPGFMDRFAELLGLVRGSGQ
jgi:hypothetical protein